MELSLQTGSGSGGCNVLALVFATPRTFLPHCALPNMLSFRLDRHQLTHWFVRHTRRGCLWIRTGKAKSVLRFHFTPMGDTHDTRRLVPSPCGCLTKS